VIAENGALAAPRPNMPFSFRRQPWLSLIPFLRVALIHALITLPSAEAGTLTWLGDVNANWSAGTSGVNTNWTTNTLPANNDSLVFDLNTATLANLSSINDLKTYWLLAMETR
jgi:hypothetical protein